MTTRATSLALAWLLALAAGGNPAAAAGSAALSFLEQRVASDPLDHLAQNRLALQYINALRSSGDLTCLDRAARAAAASLAAVTAPRNPGGLSVLAAVRYESHQFHEASALAQQALRIDPNNALAAITAADADFELGNYDTAGRSYAALGARMPKSAWHLRLSRVAEMRGDEAQALALLLEVAGTADDSAGVRLRLGEWYFAHGDLEHAREHLDAAARLEPGSYMVQEHQAELLAAAGHPAQAIAVYEKVIARVPRPEIMQALGDLHAFTGASAAAARWHERALQGYLRFTQAGNAHFYHHLASFYSDSRLDPGQALHWARRDLEIRSSIYAYEALAWALYRNGQHQDAAATMDRALAQGTRSAHLLYHAALVYTSAGRVRQGRELMQQALTVNPRYNAFHVHR